MEWAVLVKTEENEHAWSGYPDNRVSLLDDCPTIKFSREDFTLILKELVEYEVSLPEYAPLPVESKNYEDNWEFDKFLCELLTNYDCLQLWCDKYLLDIYGTNSITKNGSDEIYIASDIQGYLVAIALNYIDEKLIKNICIDCDLLIEKLIKM